MQHFRRPTLRPYVSTLGLLSPGRFGFSKSDALPDHTHIGLGATLTTLYLQFRSREGRILPVQRPSDDCEILAEVTPPDCEKFDTEDAN